MKVIFLDIDGVLVNRNSFKLPRLELTGHRLSYHTADPVCIRLLNRIVDETGAHIVISSVWRGIGLKRIREIFNAWLAQVEIIDVTPNMQDVIRGDEIQAWLQTQSGIQSFVIIDDDDDMGRLRHRLVETDCMIGLTEKDADQAIAILNAPPTDLFLDRMFQEVKAR